MSSFEDQFFAAAEMVKDWSFYGADMRALDKAIAFEHAHQNAHPYDRAKLESECAGIDFERAAYEAACRSERNNDLPAAAHWYRVAAEGDYGDAAFRLANVLSHLLLKLVQDGELLSDDDPLQQYTDLLREIAKWYLEAYCIGHDNALSLLADLTEQWGPSYDLLRRRLEAKETSAHIPAYICGEYISSASEFLLGSLPEQRAEAVREHLKTCRSCVKSFNSIVASQPAPIRNRAATNNRTFVLHLYTSMFGGLTMPG
ncbi:zf-HC2 domain-containing protein [Actinomadura sp. 6K520]|uniref:zf-HC2 domain-containing protein n=1 Tax=Actinomadura sp. 6K520 TaxID=2530364 RepID=UPI001047A9C4|nr:zf-HC2 domain-containing protein [Actinomadura sp. 6K520]TDE35459.1 zf-HC2 domain-containing protein [Actinomadura sp. 6K520]